jgi:MFS transporter, DHA1 family, multidrug resistance protein
LHPASVRLTPFLIVATTSLVLSAGNIFLPSLVLIANDLQCNTQILLFAISLYFFAFATTSIFCGALADYFGYKPIMLIGFTIFILGAISCALSTTMLGFIMGNILEGMGAAAPLIVGLATIQNLYTSEDSVKILGWMGGLLAIMPALAPILGGYLAQLGWRSNYLLLIFLGIILLFLLKRYYIKSIIARQSQVFLTQFFTGYFTILRHRQFLKYASLYPLLLIGSSLLLTTTPLYLMKNFGFTIKACGYFLGCMTLGYTLGGLITTKMVGQYHITSILRCGITTAFIASLFLLATCYFAMHYLLFLVAAFFLQFGIAMVHPPSSTIAIRFFSEFKASASAIRGTFSILGSAIGTSIAALLGHTHMFISTGITFSLAAMIFGLHYCRGNSHVSN